VSAQYNNNNKKNLFYWEEKSILVEAINDEKWDIILQVKMFLNARKFSPSFSLVLHTFKFSPKEKQSHPMYSTPFQ